MLVRAIIASSLGVMDGECSLAGDSSVLFVQVEVGHSRQSDSRWGVGEGGGLPCLAGCRALLECCICRSRGILDVKYFSFMLVLNDCTYNVTDVLYVSCIFPPRCPS